MRALLILCAIFVASTCLARDFLQERIGSGKTNSVPVGIRVTREGTSYEMEIVGYENDVGSLVTQGGKTYNISLNPDDLDVLGYLNASHPSISASNVTIQVKAMRNSDFASVQVPAGHESMVLINKVITIFNLPEYLVQRGDTLSEILLKTLGGQFTVKEIEAVNPGLDPDRLWVGQRIKIPNNGSGHSKTPTTGHLKNTHP